LNIRNEEHLSSIGEKGWIPFFYKNTLKSAILGLINKEFKYSYITNQIYKRLIKKEKIDIVHVHWAFPTGYIFHKLKKRYKTPYILTLHGSDIHTNPYKNKILKRKTIQALESANQCIFVSESLRNKALKLGYSGHNSVVIPNGYDQDIFYHNEEKEIYKLKEKKVVGFVGNLIDIKNVLILPEIFLKIQEKYKNVEFIIIGDGNLKRKLTKKLSYLNINIKLTGNIPQKKVADYMRLMDVMILPSKNEGWPCVIKEAHACGTYVIGSNVGGIPEAIGKYGKVFELNDEFSANCAKHTLKVLENGFDEKQLVNSAVSYRWINIVSSEIKLYQEVLKGQNSI